MKIKEQISSSPVNSAGSGSIAGIGTGPQSEPGVHQKKKLRTIVLTKTPLKRLTPTK